MIQKHPLLPKDLPVHGLIICPETGKLDLLVDGYGR
jgi:carbonic anhydrase